MIISIPHVEPAATREAALEYARHMAGQDGCMGARVIGDGCRKSYAAQGLFEAGDSKLGDWMPDGLRVVLVPRGLLAALAIEGVRP